MIQDQTQFIELQSQNTLSRRIAYLVSEGQEEKPGVFWLSGFKSTMRSEKVTALAAWCSKQNIRLCRFDYSGHGESEGKFEDGTISKWLDEAFFIFNNKTKGKQILIGSSMGGWISLLLLKALGVQLESRIAGCIFIAPAWDMTEKLMWDRFTDEIRLEILQTGKYARPSQYGDPYIITKSLIEDGRKHLLGNTKLNINCPIRIIHGLQDPDIPWQHSEQLMSQISNEDIVLSLIKDGEHRLSRAQDLGRLLSEVSLLLGGDNG